MSGIQWHWITQSLVWVGEWHTMALDHSVTRVVGWHRVALAHSVTWMAGSVAYSGTESLSHLFMITDSRVVPPDGCTYLRYQTAG